MDVDDTYDGRTSAHRHFERGEGKLKAVIYTTILLLAIYSAVKIVPAYVSEYQLADKMQEHFQDRAGLGNSREARGYQSGSESCGGQDFYGLHRSDRFILLSPGFTFLSVQ